MPAQPSQNSAPKTVIIGAGPAGLSAAYELARHGGSPLVLERSRHMGGLARTETYQGCSFDIGGHRFFTKVSLVHEFWQSILGEDFVVRPRLSRIYYRSRFFQYPIEPWNALTGLGVWEAGLCGLSYLRARVNSRGPEENLEDWLTARFGQRLYRTFFKTYTEKVWGIPCREIAADWAAQRIRGLTLSSVLRDALKLGDKEDGPKSLIQQFHYPRKGPGMMWERVRDFVLQHGGEIRTEKEVTALEWKPGKVTAVHVNGERVEAEQFISSMPVRDLVRCLTPEAPRWLTEAAEQLRYRDFLTVALMVRGPSPFPDNWIYVHDPGVKVGRIQNYGNWSPDMVPSPDITCLGLEYFCFESDHLWETGDDELIEQAKDEVHRLGLVPRSAIFDGTVLRVPKAYPVYDDRYQSVLDRVRDFLATVPNLQLIGRNGMHRYNNQDHSVLTGMLAARNILGQGRYDLWRVNADAEYHEDGFHVTTEEIQQMEAQQPLTPHGINRSGPPSRRP